MPERITPPPRVVAFPDRFETAVRLRDGREVDAEFEGDPAPAAPLAGWHFTLVDIPR